MPTAAVLTVSDSCFRGERMDRSGPAVADALRASGYEVVETRTVPDEVPEIAIALRELARRAALVLSTGGTGISARDVTPEATLSVCDRLLDGLPERMRAEGARQTPLAYLSRGVAGVCGTALVVNLPGSPAGAVASLDAVLPLVPHALALLAGETDHGEGERVRDGREASG